MTSAHLHFSLCLYCIHSVYIFLSTYFFLSSFQNHLTPLIFPFSIIKILTRTFFLFLYTFHLHLLPTLPLSLSLSINSLATISPNFYSTSNVHTEKKHSPLQIYSIGLPFPLSFYHTLCSKSLSLANTTTTLMIITIIISSLQKKILGIYCPFFYISPRRPHHLHHQSYHNVVT